MNTVTVKCSGCDWITDLNTLSETTPTRCPKCGGGLLDAYTDEQWPPKKTEFDFGREYAEFMRGNGECDHPVDIEEMVSSTASVPDGDYTEMVGAGIENPNSREYWRGFNSVFAEGE